MKKPLIPLILILCSFISQSQVVISIPYEHYYSVQNLPKSNEQITYSLLHPFADFPDFVPDPESTHQYILNLPAISDSLLNQYVKFAMLSLGFDQKYNGYKQGAEIWDGVLKSIPTVAGIYYKNTRDSTRLYVFTGYSMTYFDKKRKNNLSKLVCERVQTILNRDAGKR